MAELFFLTREARHMPLCVVRLVSVTFVYGVVTAKNTAIVAMECE